MARRIRRQRMQSKNTHIPVIEPEVYDHMLSFFERERERYILKELKKVTSRKREPLQPILTIEMVVVGLFTTIESAVLRFNTLFLILGLPYRFARYTKTTGGIVNSEYRLNHYVSTLVYVD